MVKIKSVLYISNSTFVDQKANSIQVIKTCEGMLELNYAVTLFGFKSIKNLDNDTIKNTYNVKLVPQLKLLNIRNNRFGRIVYSFIIFSKLVGYDRRNIVFCRFILGAVIAKILGFHVIYETHSPAENKRKILEKILMHIMGSDPIICISENLKQYYCSLYKNASKRMYSVHDAASDIYPHQSVTTKKDNIVCGYIGSLYEGKGAEQVLRLAEIIPDVFFVIIGGKNQDYLKLSNNKDFNNVIYHEHVTQKELFNYIEAIDVMLLPAQRIVRTSNGGNISSWMSPLKLFEYMSYKKAIIASDLITIREILTSNHDAILCQPDNLIEWKTAINSLKDPELRLKLSQNAYSSFAENYTYKQRAFNILSKLDHSV